MFSVYVFVNVNLSDDNFQPSTVCSSSFPFIVTITSLFVICVVEYVTFVTGAILSIFVTTIFVGVSFPAKSFIFNTSPFSDVFSAYVLVNVILSADKFQPSTFCISSFNFIVTITSLFVGSVSEYCTFASGGVLSKLKAPLLVIVSFPKLSSAYIHKYHFPSPVSFVIS